MADKYILNERFFGRKTRVSQSIADQIASLYGPNAVLRKHRSYSVEIPLFTKQQYERYSSDILDTLAQAKSMLSPRIFVPSGHALTTQQFVYDYIEHQLHVAGEASKHVATKYDFAKWAEPFKVKALTVPFTSEKPMLYAGESGMSLVRPKHNVYNAMVTLAGFQTDKGQIIPLSANVNAHLKALRPNAVYPYFEVYAPKASAFADLGQEEFERSIRTIAQSRAGSVSERELQNAKETIDRMLSEGQIAKYGINAYEWNTLKREALLQAPYNQQSFLSLQLNRATAVARATRWKKNLTQSTIERLKSYTPKAETLAFDIETLSTGNVLQVGLSKAGDKTSMLLKDTYETAELFAPPPLTAPGYISVLTQAAAGKGAYEKADVTKLFSSIQQAVKARKTKLLGYNVLGFDFEQLQHAGMLDMRTASFLKNNVVDVYYLLQKYQPVVETVYGVSLPNLQLTTVATKLGVASAEDIAAKAHSADYDAWLTEQVYQKVAFAEAMDNAFAAGKPLPFNLSESLLKYESAYFEAYKALEEMDESVMSYKKLDQILRSKGEKFLGTRGALTGFESGYVDIQGARLGLRFSKKEGTLEITGKTLGPVVEAELDTKADLFNFTKYLSKQAKDELAKSLKKGETTFVRQMLMDSMRRQGALLAVESERNVTKYFSTVSNVLYNPKVDADLLTLRMRLPKVIENQRDFYREYTENMLESIGQIPKILQETLLPSKAFVDEYVKRYSTKDVEDLSNWLIAPQEFESAKANDIANKLLETLGSVAGSKRLSQKEADAIKSVLSVTTDIGVKPSEFAQLYNLISSGENISKYTYTLSSYVKEMALQDEALEKEFSTGEKVLADILARNAASKEETVELLRASTDAELKYSSPAVLGGLKGETIAEIKDAFIDFTRKYSGNANISDLQQLYQEYIRNVRGFITANSMMEMKYRAPNEIADMYKPGSTALQKAINLAEKYTSPNVSYKIEDFKGYLQAMIENEVHNMFEKASKRGTNTLAEFVKELNASPVFNIFDDKLPLSDKLAFAMYYLSSANGQNNLSVSVDTEVNKLMESIFNEDNLADVDIIPNDIKEAVMSETADEQTIRKAASEAVAETAEKDKRLKEINLQISNLFEKYSDNYETVYNKLRKSFKKMTAEEKIHAIGVATQYYSNVSAKVSSKYIKRLHKYNLSVLKNQNASLANLGMVEVETINSGNIKLDPANAEEHLERALSEMQAAMLSLQHHKTSDESVTKYTEFLKQNIDALNKKVATFENELKNKLSNTTRQFYKLKDLLKRSKKEEKPDKVIDAISKVVDKYENNMKELDRSLKLLREKYKPALESYKTLANAQLYIKPQKVAASKAESKIAGNSLFAKMHNLSKGKKVELSQDELLLLKALGADNITLRINKKAYAIGEPVVIKVNGEATTILPLIGDKRTVFIGEGGKIAEFEGVAPEELASISAQLQKQKYEVVSEGSPYEMMPQAIKDALAQAYEQRRAHLKEQQEEIAQTAQAFEEKVETIQQVIDKYKLKAEEMAKAKETQEVLDKYSGLDDEAKAFIDNLIEQDKELFAKGKQYDDETANIVENIQRIVKEEKDSELAKVIGVKEQLKKAAETLKRQAEYKQTVMNELANQEPSAEDIAQAIKKIAKEQNATKAREAAKYAKDGVNYYNETAEKLISKTSLKNSVKGVQEAATKLVKDARFWKVLGIVAAVSGGLYALSYTATKGTSKEDIHKALKTQVQNDTRYHPQLLKDFSFVMTPYGVDIDYYADTYSNVNYPTSYVQTLGLDRTSVRR